MNQGNGDYDLDSKSRLKLESLIKERSLGKYQDNLDGFI